MCPILRAGFAPLSGNMFGRNASYTHSGGVTTEYFTDVDGGSVYVRIDNVEEHKDAVETMMKSLEFADDIAEAKTEAMDVKLDDIEIKH